MIDVGRLGKRAIGAVFAYLRNSSLSGDVNY